MVRPIRPQGKPQTQAEEIAELKYLVYRICETMKIKTRFD